MSKYAIHEAARDDKPLTVQSLLEQDPKCAVVRDEDARTPLHWACTMNNGRIVDMLLPYVTCDLDELVDDSGWTPVHISAAVGSGAVFAKLMAREPAPDVDLPTGTGATCLHLAVSKNHYDFVAALIKEHRCAVRAKDKRGRTALHRAAAIGSQPLVRMLVEAKAHVNAQDSDGWTPLHHALAEGHGDVGQLLVALGADAAVENHAGEDASSVACESVRRFFDQSIK